jgi:hypothetical protein
MRDLVQGVQRELQVGLVGPTAGAPTHRDQQALVAWWLPSSGTSSKKWIT